MKHACLGCDRNIEVDPDPYLDNLLILFELKKAGYPFEKNDLTVEQWIDLNRIDNELIKLSIPDGNGK